MNAKAILSSKGQLVIPKLLRTKLGLHSGSELTLELTNDDYLELHPVKNSIIKFFGMGKNKADNKITSIEDMDNIISKVVADNDRN